MSSNPTISIECGSDKGNAETISRYFKGVTWTLLDGSTRQGSCYIYELNGAWWCVVIPMGVTVLEESLRHVPLLAQLVSELPNQLYDQLRICPSLYRYAIRGIEVDEFHTYEGLLQQTSLLQYPGLVVSDEIASHFSSDDLERFSLGYMRVPLRGGL